MLIGAVALIIVGPQRLPGMLGTLGKWSNKLRRMLFDVRQQSGIDDILRAEGISGGLKEIRDLRNAVRGNVTGLLTSGAAAPRQGVQQLVNQQKATSQATAAAAPVEAVTDPYADVSYDRTREYPDEGADAYGSIPDDLWAAARSTAPASQVPASQVPASQAATVPGADAALTTAAVAIAVASAAETVSAEAGSAAVPEDAEKADPSTTALSPQDTTESEAEASVSADADPTDS